MASLVSDAAAKQKHGAAATKDSTKNDFHVVDNDDTFEEPTDKSLSSTIAFGSGVVKVLMVSGRTRTRSTTSCLLPPLPYLRFGLLPSSLGHSFPCSLYTSSAKPAI